MGEGRGGALHGWKVPGAGLICLYVCMYICLHRPCSLTRRMIVTLKVVRLLAARGVYILYVHTGGLVGIGETSGVLAFARHDMNLGA